MNADWQLVDRGSGRVVVPRLELATNFLRRFAGLQLRPRLPVGQGLLLAPCNGVHSFAMRFPIDCFYLDRSGTVLRARRGLRPWRMILPAAGAWAMLEVAEGSCTLEAGERLCLRPALDTGQTAPLPHSLAEMRC